MPVPHTTSRHKTKNTFHLSDIFEIRIFALRIFISCCTVSHFHIFFFRYFSCSSSGEQLDAAAEEATVCQAQKTRETRTRKPATCQGNGVAKCSVCGDGFEEHEAKRPSEQKQPGGQIWKNNQVATHQPTTSMVKKERKKERKVQDDNNNNCWTTKTTTPLGLPEYFSAMQYDQNFCCTTAPTDYSSR